MPRLKICLSPKLPNAPLVPESANLLVTVGSGAGAAGAAFEPRINSFQGDFEGASTSPGALSSPAKCALFCPSYRSDRRSIESNGGLVSIGSSGFWFCNCVVSNCRNVLKLLATIVESTAVPLELVEVLAAVPLVDGVEVADLCPPPKTGSVCLLASAAEHPLRPGPAKSGPDPGCTGHQERFDWTKRTLRINRNRDRHVRRCWRLCLRSWANKCGTDDEATSCRTHLGTDSAPVFASARLAPKRKRAEVHQWLAKKRGVWQATGRHSLHGERRQDLLSSDASHCTGTVATYSKAAQ